MQLSHSFRACRSKLSGFIQYVRSPFTLQNSLETRQPFPRGVKLVGGVGPSASNFNRYNAQIAERAGYSCNPYSIADRPGREPIPVSLSTNSKSYLAVVPLTAFRPENVPFPWTTQVSSPDRNVVSFCRLFHPCALGQDQPSPFPSVSPRFGQAPKIKTRNGMRTVNETHDYNKLQTR